MSNQMVGEIKPDVKRERESNGPSQDHPRNEGRRGGGRGGRGRGGGGGPDLKVFKVLSYYYIFLYTLFIFNLNLIKN